MWLCVCVNIHEMIRDLEIFFMNPTWYLWRQSQGEDDGGLLLFRLQDPAKAAVGGGMS